MGCPPGVAPLAGSVDRNCPAGRGRRPAAPSLPSRGAWIEMAKAATSNPPKSVAPLAGSVDRNWMQRAASARSCQVAPLAGSVDRNAARYMEEYGKLCRSPRGERG